MRAGFLALVVLVAFCPPALAQQPKPEPKYEGKPLAYWVDRLQKVESAEDRYAAGRAIVAFDVDAAPAIPKLVEMLDDRSEQFRELVASVLSDLKPLPKEIVPELTRLLKENHARGPEVVIRTLGSFGPAAKEAVPILIPLLQMPGLRDSCLVALCQIGPDAKAALPAIRLAVLDLIAASRKDPDVRLFPLEELQQLGPDVVPVLLDILDGLNTRKPPFGSTAWGYAFEALQKLGPAAGKATPKLMMLLKHEKPDVRLDAAVTLWGIEKCPAAIPVLAALLKEKDYDLVRSAAVELGAIGPEAKETIPALKAAMKAVVPRKIGDGLSVVSIEEGRLCEAVQNAITKIESPQPPKKEANHQ